MKTNVAQSSKDTYKEVKARSRTASKRDEMLKLYKEGTYSDEDLNKLLGESIKFITGRRGELRALGYHLKVTHTGRSSEGGIIEYRTFDKFEPILFYQRGTSFKKRVKNVINKMKEDPSIKISDVIVELENQF